MFGQCIVKAAKPKSAIPPIPFGLAVACGHMFGSRRLIDEPFRLRFSISYSEVNRFKQSVLQHESKHQSINVVPTSFMETSVTATD